MKNLFIFLASFSSLIGGATPSYLSPEEYKTAFAILSKAAGHQKFISDQVIERIQEGKIKRGKFLDIGCGPGVITRELMPYFSSTTLVEPNAQFVFPENAIVHQVPFEKFSTEEKFDLILCSHVFYHIPQNEWQQTIDRMLQMLTPEGVLVIAMECPGSEIDLFRRHFNENYLGSLPKKISGFNLEAIYSKHFYEISNEEDLFTLCRFLVLENCFTPESYAALSLEKRKGMDREIREFAHRHAEDNLDWNQELLFFNEGQGPGQGGGRV